MPGFLTLLRKRKIALLVIAAMLMSGSLVWALGNQEGEVRFLVVTGQITDRQRTAVEETLLASGEPLSNISHVKNQVESIPWVKTADVTLRWPDELIIDVKLQQAIAYWNDDAFINSEGYVFKAELFSGGDLPQLYGPAGKEKKLMELYQELNRALASSGSFIEVLRLNQRGAVEFEDQFGVLVALGNTDINQRLQRFLKVKETIGIRHADKRVRRIDTRYTNGVAVEFVEPDGQLAKNITAQRETSL